MDTKKFLLLSFCILFYGFTNAQTINDSQKIGNISIDVPANIAKLVHLKFSENYGDTYKIQLYYGELDQAHSILGKFKTKFSKWSGKVLFETPNFKVWVGNFRTRLEADRALMSIRREFPSAFIFKPKSKK